MTHWPAVLDALEAEADELVAAAGDPLAVEALLRESPRAVPTTLGPLPHELAPRARAVLARLRAAEEALRGGRDAVTRALTARPPSPPPAPRYVDRSF